MIPVGDNVPRRSWPLVTWALMAINVWVFINEVLLGPQLEEFIQTWGFIPARYFYLAEVDPSDLGGRFLPLLTSMFLHGGVAHLIGNMLYLGIFGDNVEDHLGHLRYLALYLLTGIGAGLAQAYLQPLSTIPAVGASGAISGVLGAFLVLFPYARVITVIPLLFFFPLWELPAALYLAFWFLMQLTNGTLTLAVAGETGGVAWWAHVGGFVVGMALTPALRRRQSYPRVWRDEFAG